MYVFFRSLWHLPRCAFGFVNDWELAYAVLVMITLHGNASLGASRFNAFNASWPFGSLSISKEQLCICAVLRSVTIRREELARICLNRAFFVRGYRFHLKNAGKMSYISFATWNLKKTLSALEEHGWAVDLSANG